MVEKIKINMLSGASIEKPLVTAFKGNGGEYVVLDNETNGTMGLPIILVSKLENNKLSLINDAEWTAVKESLRQIIAGNQVDYVTVETILAADDMFFKQLTLPVASFEALKNNYKPVGDATTGAAPVSPAPMEQPMSVEQPVNMDMNVNPNPNPTPAPNMQQPFSSVGPMPTPTPVVEPQPIEAPVAPSMDVNPMSAPTPVESVAPQMVEPQVVAPVNNIAPEVTPVMPTAPMQNQTVAEVAPVAPEQVVAPSVEPIPTPVEDNTPVDFTADKEAFLKACENMFDALVAKFKN